jgi:hypothetical protein
VEDCQTVYIKTVTDKDGNKHHVVLLPVSEEVSNGD